MTRKLFIDFETYFNKKSGYDLAQMSTTEYVRDAQFKAHGFAYQWEDQAAPTWVSDAEAMAVFVTSVDWKDTVVVAHSVKFDGAVLAWRYGVRPAAWLCTQALAEAVLGEWVPNYKLATLARYLGLPDKGAISCDGERTPTAEHLKELGDYCVHDVELCKGIHDRLIGKFPPGQLWHMDWTVRCFVEPTLELDAGVLKKGVDDEARRRSETIAKSGLDGSVLRSNPKFAKYLLEVGVRVPTKRSPRTGQEIPAFAKTDEGLEALRHSHPALHAARLAAKSSLLETRGKALLAVAKTGSFPCDIEFSGATQTHRYSGRSGAGGNFQNFTRGSFLREAVCAPKGHSLIVGDLAKIELTVLAWLAKEPKLIDKLRRGGNPYTDFASEKYGRPITKADTAEYQYGKESILALGYQMWVQKFQARIKAVIGKDITYEEGLETVLLYRDTFFNVPKLWEKCQSVIPLIAEGKVSCLFFAPFIKVRKGALILPDGLEIKYPNLRAIDAVDHRGRPAKKWVYDVYFKGSEPEPTGLYGGKMTENLCQALVGCICKDAIRRTEECDIPCKAQVHDEVHAVVPADDSELFRPAEECAKIMKACMERPPAWMPDMCVRAEVKTGQNWKECK